MKTCGDLIVRPKVEIIQQTYMSPIKDFTYFFPNCAIALVVNINIPEVNANLLSKSLNSFFVNGLKRIIKNMLT